MICKWKRRNWKECYSRWHAKTCRSDSFQFFYQRKLGISWKSVLQNPSVTQWVYVYVISTNHLRYWNPLRKLGVSWKFVLPNLSVTQWVYVNVTKDENVSFDAKSVVHLRNHHHSKWLSLYNVFDKGFVQSVLRLFMEHAFRFRIRCICRRRWLSEHPKIYRWLVGNLYKQICMDRPWIWVQMLQCIL